ncbi:PREDICTED: uncharacterized protein LOC104586881 [Nelumbo nucifera]|uniref:Protein DMP2-like n=2 Tax=Nelumbo nucifera TaxID=4432 RepID=A0A822Z333_NELNU|nr:PREDICTED: uncharacterized protein LOC104586881 [Nelumbo nucifera]DAD37859.1 TPA_asm: hypothetical protein HUJ06_008500 [Nelumbo nucifera]
MDGQSSSTESSTTQAVTSKAFTGVGNLIKLLPTGTVFLFQFLSPVLTNNGECNTSNKYLTGILLVVCGISCCVLSFTDSYTDSKGNTKYGIATTSGMWPSSSDSVNLSDHKLQLRDFVHAFFSLIVFMVVVLLDPNVVQCYYPSFKSDQELLLKILPPIIGALSSSTFVIFPSKRNGIGYPQTQQS